MVRQLTFQAVIHGCTIKEFYQIACSDSKAITQFHLEVNKDDTVTVSEWDQSRTLRTVTFTMDVAIPAALKRFVGAEPIRIKEKQKIEWVDDSTLKITSVPILQLPIAKSLSTEAELYITTTSEGCQIDVTVTVSASVTWPLQSTVESLMADEARKTVGQYVDYIGKYVENALEEMNNQAMLQEQQEQVLGAAAEAQQAIEEVAAAAVDHALVEQQPQLAIAPRPKQQPGVPAAAPTALFVDATAGAVAAPAGRLRVAVPAAAEPEEFHDAQEVLGNGEYVMQALLRELQQAQQARHEANRLLISIKDSVQQMEKTIMKEAAFQEGVRYGQRLGTGSVLLSTVAAASAASAVTAYVLMRRNR